MGMSKHIITKSEQFLKAMVCRCSRRNQKAIYLTGGGPEIDLFSMSQEVSRSHISWSNEPLNKAEVSQPMKD